MQPSPAHFAPILIAAAIFFTVSCYRRFSLVALGATEERLDRFSLRFRQMLRYAFGQKQVIAEPSGFNHFVIFWSFMILLLANGEFLANALFPSVSLHRLPVPLREGLLLAFDAGSALTLVSIAFALLRRLFFKPEHLDSLYVKGRSGEAFLILALIGFLIIDWFCLNGVRIAAGKEEITAWMPVSRSVAFFFNDLPGDVLTTLGSVFWWIHALLLLGFICFLPHSKHMHILTAIPNCFFGSLEKGNTQPREEFVSGGRFGAGQVSDFTWKDLFDSFSCTECGRCQKACPASATGKPLNPRQVVHSLKTNLLANSQHIRSGVTPSIPLIGPEGEETSTEDSIWSCTTCGACLDVCPVMIEQMPKIVKMRRYLVEMEARFPEELLNLFENIENRSNPWGIAPAERAKWQAGMEVKPFVAGETEYLFYVGCAGAFNSRQKQVSLAVAAILDAAGVSWGTFGKEEKCCGDSLRRLGNEYSFDVLARENVQLFREKGVRKVITACPHCFSTLKNDYRQYGLELEVVHHAELINSLLGSGELTLDRPVTELGRVLFHDSCYLGRHNDMYDAPREALSRATGSAPGEFPRNGNSSFCCGAGGGRMWMEEHLGERINLARVEEALLEGSDTICVACPYCMTMFEDGLKDKSAERTKVKDIAEIVAGGLGSEEGLVTRSFR